MSMESSRPQLDLDELRQLKWLLGGLLSLISLTALLYLEIHAWPFLLAGGLLVPAVLLRPELPARIPVVLHRLVFVGVAVFAAADIFLNHEVLATTIRVDALLLLYRSCHYRRRREELQLIVLGFFLVVMAGVITVSLVFAVQIVAFVACALLLLFVVTLADSQEGAVAGKPIRLDETPAWAMRRWASLFSRVKATCDWRVFALGGALFAGFVAVSGVLFMAIPRFELNSGLSFDRMLPRKSTTGFSDSLKFGDVTDIQQDNSVVLRVEPPDRTKPPTAAYWRMVVMDEYREGVFRMSEALKNSSFLKETTVVKVMGQGRTPRTKTDDWTFYLEAGTSRFLPLAGGFRRLAFSEPQSIRYAPLLGLLMFGREPASMKAYRAEGMEMDGIIQGSASGADGSYDATGFALTDTDQETLKKIVGEITGGVRLSAKGFAKEAMLWLARQHSYSLKSTLPPGTSDPLVRWVASREPGHCELFAASFVLLARMAGHQARIAAGYLGGVWNGDYLMVRNSDAHAWCEIHLGRGEWLRVDPTNDGPRLLTGSLASSLSAASVKPGAWEARLDRLRMLWYRHIVNFDRAEQQMLVNRLKSSAEAAGRRIREWTEALITAGKRWMAAPWDGGRRVLVFGVVLLVMAAGYIGVLGLRRYGRRRKTAPGAARDPVRREAGFWLQRLDKVQADVRSEDVRQALIRLRYGHRETWPSEKAVFQAARAVYRKRR